MIEGRESCAGMLRAHREMGLRAFQHHAPYVLEPKREGSMDRVRDWGYQGAVPCLGTLVICLPTLVFLAIPNAVRQAGIGALSSSCFNSLVLFVIILVSIAFAIHSMCLANTLWIPQDRSKFRLVRRHGPFGFHVDEEHGDCVRLCCIPVIVRHSPNGRFKRSMHAVVGIVGKRFVVLAVQKRADDATACARQFQALFALPDGIERAEESRPVEILGYF